MDFKKWLGTNVPKVSDESWNEGNSSYFEIFSEQLLYLFECSRLGENRESKMIHSD